MATPDHPYLTGAMAPLAEEVDAEDLPVSGRVPEALEGLFLRNGPNPQYTPRGDYHVFDGDGMLHGLWLGGGRARRYRNRWVDTAWLEVERRFERSCFGGMTDFDPVAKEAQAEIGPVKNPANTHVIRHAGRTLALWEVGPPHEVDDDLETIGIHDFGGRLTGSMTAHPHIDPTTGDLLFFGYGLFPPYLTYYRADAVTGEIVEKAEIDLPDPVMMHDFVITADHVVFLDAPAVFDFDSALAGGPAFDWRPKRGTRFGVFARSEGPSSIRWYDVDPGYVFHFLNGFEDGGVLHVDGCKQERLNMGVTEEEQARPELPHLTRWSIDLGSGKVREERLDDALADFPRIDERRTGLPNRFGYLTGWSSRPATGVGTFDQVTRLDLRDGSKETYRYGSGRTTGETIFAPDPDGTDEDEGWLLSHVQEVGAERSEVVILDARDVAAGPVATVHLPHRVPFGFHGSWIPGA